MSSEHAIAQKVIAQREGVVLRRARDDDLAAIGRLTAVGYAPIQESFVAMLGEDCYDAVQADPGQTWEERETAQNRRVFAEHPEQVWVLDDDGRIVCFVTVDTGFDDAHIPARRAYAAVGFDRSVPSVDLWRRL